MILLAVLAAAIQNIVVVLLVQAEARDRPLMAAVFAGLTWIASIATTAIVVTSLQDGHHRVSICIAVAASTSVGTYLGVKLGSKTV